MKKEDADQLINRLFGGEELEAVRCQTLESGLMTLRHGRARRRTFKTSALFCLVLLPVFVVCWQLRSNFKVRQIAQAQQKHAHAASANDQGLKIISDAELFALFPGRPLALIGRPGQQQLVFLDEQNNPAAPITQ